MFLFQSLVTLDGSKLIHVQKWDGKETTLVREVDGNSLTLVSTACASSTTELIACLLGEIFADFRLYSFQLQQNLRRVCGLLIKLTIYSLWQTLTLGDVVSTRSYVKAEWSFSHNCLCSYWKKLLPCQMCFQKLSIHVPGKQNKTLRLRPQKHGYFYCH